MNESIIHLSCTHSAVRSASSESPLFHCPFLWFASAIIAISLIKPFLNSRRNIHDQKEGLSSTHVAVPMAAPPVKSQPLHNFSLPHLKWAHKSSSSSASASSSHQHRPRRRDSPDRRHRRKGSSSPDPENPSQQSPPDSPRNDGFPPEGDENGEGKPWNLRPRKESNRAAAAAAAAENNVKKGDGSCSVVKSQRLRGMVEGGQLNGGAERKGKRRIWVSLSKEEIEEDVYALTGGKPSRRPRKWPKNVQKHMENVFPGSYLAGVAADSYRAMLQ